MLEIEPGDVVLTPHQLDWGKNGVWRVTQAYQFDPLPNMWDGEPDFGNVLGVEPLGVIDHRSSKVSSGLRRALTSGFRPRMRQLTDYGEEIERLMRDPDAALPSDAAQHFEAVRLRAREALFEALVQQYGNADFERPIGALLESIYPDAVTPTAGPSERGRDFVIEDVDKLGLSRSIIVQVKSWSGKVENRALQHGLQQLKQGVEVQEAQGRSVDLAVLLTLADELPPDADKTIAMAKEEIAVRITVLTREQTLDLLLDQLAHMSL